MGKTETNTAKCNSVKSGQQNAVKTSRMQQFSAKGVESRLPNEVPFELLGRRTETKKGKRPSHGVGEAAHEREWSLRARCVLGWQESQRGGCHHKEDGCSSAGW